MRFDEDPRVAVARRSLALSWVFFTVFVATTMAVAASLGDEPLVFGLPRWAALACVVVPAVFVAALVPIVEKLIPDVPLSDEEDEPR
jgi:uncharacterized membrane protein YhdT